MAITNEQLSRYSASRVGGIDEDDVHSIISKVMDKTESLYARGLAVSAFGVIMMNMTDFMSQELSLMDSLIEIVGETRSVEPQLLGYSAKDILNIRSNCCIVLSRIMNRIGEDVMEGEGEIQILPMAAHPEPITDPSEDEAKKRTTNEEKANKRLRRKRRAQEEVSDNIGRNRKQLEGITSNKSLVDSLSQDGMVLGGEPPSSRSASSRRDIAALSSSPKHLYQMGATLIRPQSGDPLPRNSKNGEARGLIMDTRGEFKMHYTHESRGPQRRVGVLFGNTVPDDAKVPLAKSSDVFEVDRRLGYQIPRVWFPHQNLNTAGTPLDVPERSGPLERALRPHTSGLVVNEFFRIEARKRYLELTSNDSNHPLFNSNNEQVLRQSKSLEIETWSPGAGLKSKSISSTHLLAPQSAVTKKSAPKNVSVSSSTSGPPLAGYAYSGGAKRRQAWSVEQVSESKPSRKRKASTETRDDLPPPPAVSSWNEFQSLGVAERSAVAAAKAVAETRSEAKAFDRSMRLHAVVRTQDLPPEQLIVAANKEHRGYMTSLENELKAVLASKTALQQHVIASVEVGHQALPLRFLFTTPGGPALCRIRLRRAFSYWISEFEKNQCTVAFALWRIFVSRQQFQESTEVYHKDAGGTKLSAIVRKMELALKARVLARLKIKITWVIFESRNRAAYLIQRMIRRVRGLQRFLHMHDSQPIGGPLADIDMAMCRFLRFQVVPRIREDKRDFWQASILLQKVWRGTIHVRWWVRLRSTAVRLQASARVVPAQKCFLAMKKAVVMAQGLIRMVLCRWPYLRWVVYCRLLQRSIRGHLARQRANRLVLEERIHLKYGRCLSIRIQCAWRRFLARQCAEALRRHDKAEFLAALRIQFSWYRRQGNFSTFVLLGCLREQDYEEQEIFRQVSVMFRKRHAVCIQRRWRQFRKSMRYRSTLIIQSAYRMYVNFKVVTQMRRIRWAVRKLHFWAKGTMKRRHRSARKIQFWWWRSVPGRFLTHLEAISLKVEQLEADQIALTLDNAAIIIQALVHGSYVRREVKRTMAVLKLQAVARGFVGRRKAAANLRFVQREIASRFIQQLQRDSLLRELARQHKVRVNAAKSIQRIGRGYVVREVLDRARMMMRRQTLVAKKLQTQFRSHRRVSIAMADLITQRRRFLNPFKECENIPQLLHEVELSMKSLYQSDNSYAGMSMATVLKRLGLQEVTPLLRTSNVNSMEDLVGLTNRQLEAAGVIDTRIVQGEVETKVAGAVEARKLICDFCQLFSCDAQTRACFDECSYEYNLISDFEVLPQGRQKVPIVIKLFEEAYSARYASRASNFAELLVGVDVTIHQLRRFLKGHETPAKAKDNISLLTEFDEQEQELLKDEKRLIQCCDKLRYGAEKLRDMMVGEGKLKRLVLAMIKKATEAGSFKSLETLQLNRKRWIEENGQRSWLSGPQRDSSNHLVKCIAALQSEWKDLVDQNDATAFLQNTWRGYAGRNLLQEQLHAVVSAKISKGYLQERTTNLVRLVWEEDRRLEKLEYERSYKQWLIKQEKDELEDYLKTVTKYGWEEVETEEYSGEYVFRLYGDESFESAVTERPTYSVDEDAALRLLQKYYLRITARLKVAKMRHDKVRAARELAQHELWEKKKRDREQHITLSFKIGPIDQDTTVSLMKDDAAEDIVFDHRCKQFLNSMLDKDAELIVGFPIEARFDKGQNYYPGTIYQVNPTQYSTPQGMKWYPANTFGVVYDDGDFEPAVPADLIRVIRVKPGVKVEARYGGHPAFFSGIIIGENIRAGVVLSYQIEYDDGEIEKAVPRNRIRVDPDAMLAFQANWDKTVMQNQTERSRREGRAKRQQHDQEVRTSRIDKALGCFDQAWGSDYLESPACEDSDPLSSLISMVSSSRDLFHVLRPSVQVGISIEYTRLAMRFGWVELQTENKKFYYLNTITEETVWIRPTFSFEEEQAAKTLQAKFRALLGRAEFERRLRSESIMSVVEHCEVEASKNAWIGYKQEGLTLELWLNRMGLAVLVPGIVKAATRYAQRKNKPLPTNHEILQALHTATMEQLQEDYEIESSKDRRWLVSLRDSSPEAVKSLQFVNGFRSPDDERTMRDCIRQSRVLLVQLLTNTFKANPTRVEKMADELCRSKYPITYAQMNRFLSEFTGKPAMAQENIGLLVDVPTIHSAKKEAACYEVLRRGAKRLVVLASNLNVGLMSQELQKVIYKADCMHHSGSVTGPSSGSTLFSSYKTVNTLNSNSIEEVDEAGGHASKAALLLRIEAIEAAKLWWTCTIRVQTAFRKHIAERSWLRFLASRDATCLKIQCLWRGMQVREYASFLRREQLSLWEELWSEDQGVFYYFNKETGEALWNPPGGAYRPMVRDRFTQRLMQAWPHLDHPEEAADADPGMCMRCCIEQATRTCDQCVPRKAPAWAENKKHLCFACFTEEHSLSADVRKHTFTITKLAKASTLMCTICGVEATRRCKGPPVKQQLLNEISVNIEQATLASTEDESLIEMPSLKNFRDLVNFHRLPFSAERCAVLYQECIDEGSNSVADFWSGFLKVLENSKEECNDTYCARCWNVTHRRGRRAKHEWIGFAKGASVCAMCEKNVAERHCPECSDDLCTACAVATHLRGKKHRHVMTSLREELEKGMQYCAVCSVRGGNIECPLCDTPHCDSCLEFNHQECPKKTMVSDPDKPTKCIVCGRPPDTVCVECGDVYCSVKWMGNPGCFAKQHRKGHRKSHSCEPYAYMEERTTILNEAKKAKKKVEKELKRAQYKAALDEQARLDELLQRQNEREARILSEAKKIIHARKNKGWLKIPTLHSHVPLLAPLKDAIASFSRKNNNDENKSAKGSPGSESISKH